MPLQLTARTPAGARLVTLAEGHAEDLATRAGGHDVAGSYPHESLDSLVDSGYLTAPIPVEYGGLGVMSIHDLVVASSRLARGDASVAIGVNMHLVAVQSMVRRWSVARARGDERRAAAIGAGLDELARENAVLAAAVSEPSQELTRPSTTATRTDGGWRIDGRKILCTMSPAATDLYAAVRFVDDAGVERYGYVMVAPDAPGVVVHDDWDALGMRASGSNSVTFDGVHVPASALRGGFPTGSQAPWMERNLPAGLFHAAASLGVAESALEHATAALRRRGAAADGAVGALAAEAAIELSAARAALSRGGGLIDEYRAEHPDREGSDEQIAALFAEGQAVKTFVQETGARLVDRALMLGGGGAYRSGHPIARAVRDVRAGAFMNPLNVLRARDLLGRVMLGLDPAIV
jgi:alkylation response protein AidB-like acyl-CoA dehydrogenase